MEDFDMMIGCRGQAFGVDAQIISRQKPEVPHGAVLGIRHSPEHRHRQTPVIQSGQANVGMSETSGKANFGGRRCTCHEAFEVGLAEPWGEIGNVIGSGWPDLKAGR